MTAKKNSSIQYSAEAHNNFALTKIAEGDLTILLRGLLHELRNPLSSILTAASLVQDTANESAQISEESLMLLGVIKKESLRLNRILTEFSNYIKLPVPDPHDFDLVVTLRSLIGKLQRDGVLHARIVVEDDLPETSLARADPEQIRTALHHLFSNAAEAMPEGGTLHLSLREEENCVVLCVGDSGAGFSRQSKERAFQPFYSTKQYSVGLGMSAARAILEAASGHIWIKNIPPVNPSDTASSNHSSNDPATRVSSSVCIELPRAAKSIPSQS